MKNAKVKKAKAIKKNTKARERLARFENKVIDITGNFIRFGMTTEQKIQNTILLKDIRLANGSYICQHIWVRANEVFNLQQFMPVLKEGMMIKFKGKAYAYYCECRKKIYSVKYSIKEINIINIVNEEC